MNKKLTGDNKEKIATLTIHKQKKNPTMSIFKIPFWW